MVKTYSAMPIKPSAGGGMGGAGLTLKSVSGAGPVLGNIPAAAQEAGATSAASTAASEAARREAQKQADIDILNSMSSYGKPYSDITFDDAFKVFNGSLDAAKKFIDLKKSFAAEESSLKKIDIVVPIVDQIIKMSSQIPSAEGLAGRAAKASNWAQSKAGYMPEMTTINNAIKMIRPLIVKAMGDSGNLSQQEQASGVALLEQIPTGTTSERNQAIGMFKMIMEKATGKPWDKIIGATAPTTLKDLSNEDLLQMLNNSLRRK